MTLDVSLIVCTRNRAGKLDACLTALAGLRYKGPWELIFVDNGSTDDTAEVLQVFRDRASFPVKYVHEATPGLATARNAGLSVASSEVIGFTDDDCYAEPDLLERTVQTFSDPHIGYAGGRIRPFDPDDFPITILDKTERVVFPPRSFLRTGCVMGANMAFRRSALREAGDFDPLFGAGSYFPAEDIDAVSRVSLKGWTGVYEPAMVVHHHHGRKRADLHALHQAYDRGRGAYHMKLLLRGAPPAWFLRANLDLLKRFPRQPGSAAREAVASIEYVLRVAGVR
jgi:glycosyltransferase involved in cell wall biosynthesis